ncbi:hypothetical protein HOU47_gp57 [Arthrobacter phage Constance]|uniref:Uncharacterized protein n=3 Tax=Bridgettevirus TaxID=2733170 RepID=A0A3G2KIE9_9CAUD|nr:hypothetical protein HOU47_gp57 [Arthrobacter phage Constance]YP_009815538.1 hypothetical protein HOU50_gp60 [Arthrobacter phage Judy]YP_009815607.1 hypothetical protein HOU51_gp57 [Arthrobacter phage Peas]AYN57463.1 hypothetical protein PBI_CONSTANCE_57 [Arthrobacter phage Constance]AYN58130.1 hypothetical protein PBI_JUDY_60 [Arthrobacter phage Judy]AYN58744.1 hypothetical protein PBI_PEAS_57 [Arthrobacter phage Peas]
MSRSIHMDYDILRAREAAALEAEAARAAAATQTIQIITNAIEATA